VVGESETVSPEGEVREVDDDEGEVESWDRKGRREWSVSLIRTQEVGNSLGEFEGGAGDGRRWGRRFPRPRSPKDLDVEALAPKDEFEELTIPEVGRVELYPMLLHSRELVESES